MEKVILFYKFTPVHDPETVMHWQRALCEKLGLKGRVLISKHGINGTLGGDLKNLKLYTRAMKAHSAFKGMQFKWSDGSADDCPRLSIKVREEIVTFGAADELQVDENGVVGGGKHLKPEAVHKLLEERGDDVVFFDGRNAYEAEIGKFKDAVVPSVKNTRDFKTELEDPKYDAIKDKPVVTYCTGGIRCEVLSVLMKNRGFKEVYQIDGGIVKYGEKFGDDGKWEGKLHVFDNRMVHSFSDKAKDIGTCVHCQGKTSNYENCAEKSCNRLVLICTDCKTETLCENCTSQAVTA
jgi:UPF0176 protein